ncbi:MAG: peptide chain release factor N(5)-glutamine methyltransferase [Eubacteriales bacterium]
MSNILTIIGVLKKETEYLNSCGVEEPRIEADILLASVLKVTRDKLYLERESILSVEQISKFQSLIKLRGTRVPLAYILKTREFMGLDLYVDERVLIPRPETELIAEEVINEEKSNIKRGRHDLLSVLDLCTGSGAVAIALAYYMTEARVTGTDISSGAIEVARKNAINNKVKIDWRLGDLFNPVQGKKFDWIISNPPYVSVEEYEKCSFEVKKEPKLALCGGKNGLDFYQRISSQAEAYLKPKGKIVLEIGYNQAVKVRELFEKKGYTTKVLADLAGLDRIVIAMRV